MRWDIPARGELPPISFYWHNGSSRPGMRDELERLLGRGLDWGDKGEKKWADWAGCLIVGTEGKIYASGHNATFVMLPEEKFKHVQKDRPEKVDPLAGPQRGLAAGLPRRQAALGELRLRRPADRVQHARQRRHAVRGRAGVRPAGGKILNNPEADKALGSEYRQGWTL